MDFGIGEMIAAALSSTIAASPAVLAASFPELTAAELAAMVAAETVTVATPLSQVATTLANVGTLGKTIGDIAGANRSAQAYQEQAKAIGIQSKLEINAQKKKDLYTLSKNQARTEASGIVSGSGSPLEFELENAFNSGMNLASMKYAGDLRKRNALLSASNQTGQIPGLIFSGLSSIAGNWWRSSR